MVRTLPFVPSQVLLGSSSGCRSVVAPAGRHRRRPAYQPQQHRIDYVGRGLFVTRGFLAASCAIDDRPASAITVCGTGSGSLVGATPARRTTLLQSRDRRNIPAGSPKLLRPLAQQRQARSATAGRVTALAAPAAAGIDSGIGRFGGIGRVLDGVDESPGRGLAVGGGV
jgi:hypothetical protein